MRTKKNNKKEQIYNKHTEINIYKLSINISSIDLRQLAIVAELILYIQNLLLSILKKLFIVGSSAPSHLVFSILRFRTNIWHFIKAFR